MNLNNFTLKAQESVQLVSNIAGSKENNTEGFILMS